MASAGMDPSPSCRGGGPYKWCQGAFEDCDGGDSPWLMLATASMMVAKLARALERAGGQQWAQQAVWPVAVQPAAGCWWPAPGPTATTGSCRSTAPPAWWCGGEAAQEQQPVGEAFNKVAAYFGVPSAPGPASCSAPPGDASSRAAARWSGAWSDSLGTASQTAEAKGEEVEETPAPQPEHFDLAKQDVGADKPEKTKLLKGKTYAERRAAEKQRKIQWRIAKKEAEEKLDRGLCEAIAEHQESIELGIGVGDSEDFEPEQGENIDPRHEYGNVIEPERRPENIIMPELVGASEVELKSENFEKVPQQGDNINPELRVEESKPERGCEKIEPALRGNNFEPKHEGDDIIDPKESGSDEPGVQDEGWAVMAQVRAVVQSKKLFASCARKFILSVMIMPWSFAIKDEELYREIEGSFLPELMAAKVINQVDVDQILDHVA